MNSKSTFRDVFHSRRSLVIIMVITAFLTPLAALSVDYISTGEKAEVSLLLKGKVPDGEFETVTIPLKRAGRLFLIEALIDGEEGNLVFDTGATGLVLNRTYFRNHTSITKGTSGGVTGHSGTTGSTVAARMELSGIFYEKTDADLANLGHIEDRRGVKILGLFGLDLLTSMEVVFDAAHNELRLNKLDENGNAVSKSVENIKYDFTEKLSMPGSIMIINAKVGERDLSFCLDTGAEINVVHYTLPKKVLSTIAISKRSGLGGSGPGSVKAVYGVMNDFQFGEHQFAQMDAAIINLTSMSDAYGCNIDGMLGFDFWQKGIFCFNFKKREIRFKATKGENE